MRYRRQKTDEIRIVGMLSAFDWLDIANPGTQRGKSYSRLFFSLPSVLGEKGRKKGGKRTFKIKKKNKKNERKQAIMLLLIC